tara:strand:- start:543 stop:752 length:210 start_codon:yes stop_codon:yes gene_type:complete
MAAKKKTWNKSKTIVIDIGKCKYCNKDMVNTDSFVAFADKTRGHYSCMEKDYYAQLIKKETNEKRLSPN